MVGGGVGGGVGRGERVARRYRPRLCSFGHLVPGCCVPGAARAGKRGARRWCDTEGRDCEPPARTLPHPRAPLRSSSVTGRRRRRPEAGFGRLRARRAERDKQAGGLQPGVRRAVLLPPPPPPLRWRPCRLEPGKTRLRARSSGVGNSTAAGAAGALRPQSPRRGGGGARPGEAEPSAYLRVRARAARRSARTPPAPAQIAAAREPPACAPGRARNSHEHQRSQGVSGPEGNPAAFRGRGLGLAERTGGSGEGIPGVPGRRPLPVPPCRRGARK